MANSQDLELECYIFYTVGWEQITFEGFKHLVLSECVIQKQQKLILCDQEEITGAWRLLFYFRIHLIQSQRWRISHSFPPTAQNSQIPGKEGQKEGWRCRNMKPKSSFTYITSNTEGAALLSLSCRHKRCLSSWGSLLGTQGGTLGKRWQEVVEDWNQCIFCHAFLPRQIPTCLAHACNRWNLVYSINLSVNHKKNYHTNYQPRSGLSWNFCSPGEWCPLLEKHFLIFI